MTGSLATLPMISAIQIERGAIPTILLTMSILGEKHPQLFAPPAVTHTAVYGPFVPVLLDGAHQQSHGQSRLQPAPSKLSEGVIPTKLSAIPISVSGGKHPHYLRHLTWPIPPPVGRLRPFQSTARVDGVVCKGTIDWF